MKKIIAFILALFMTLTLLAACGGSKDKEKEDGATTTEATKDENGVEATDPPVVTYDIDTDYATLKYPEKFKDKVDVKIDQENGYTAKFSCGDTPLFDLVFNGEDGVFLGTIVGDDGKNTEVRVISHDIDPKAENHDELNEMSGSLNVIIDHLADDYTFVTAEDAVNVDRDDVYEIKTSVVSLYYPTAWKDEVTVKVEDTSVSFSCGSVKLFDVLFGSDKGDYIGSYKDTAVSIITYNIEKGKLTSAELTNLRAMQDDVNVVLENLEKEKDFTV